MGKSAASKQQVTDYLLDLHLGVCTTADALTGIYIDTKAIWEGVANAQTPIPVNLPQLNGGPTQNGGPQGTVYYLPGNPDQVMPDNLAANFGLTGATSPAFRGIATLFFTGLNNLDLSTILEGLLTGGLDALGSLTRPNNAFIWTSNDPIIAQNVSARMLRAPKGLDPTIAMMTESVEVTTVTHTVTTTNSDGSTTDTTTSNQFIVGTDPNSFQTFEGDVVVTAATNVNTANPAHIIYEAMTNVAWGMGCPSAAFDIDSFAAAATTLFSEGLGLSVMWAQQSTVQDFVNEIINHIQAVLYLNPTTGLWTLMLIRGDYDPATLPVYDPTNATLSNYQRKLWGETVNEISVTWTNPINEGAETVTVQDLANIAIQGGSNPDSRNYYGLRTAAQATALAARDLRAAAAPLRSMLLIADRASWKRVPGQCIVVNWPEYRVEGAIMRIGKIDYGKKTDPTIKITLLEDVFSLDHPTFTQAPGSAWVDPTQPPTPIDNAEIITLPAFFTLTADFQGAPIEVDYPDVLAAALVYKQDREVASFDLYTPMTDATGADGYALAGTKTITERSVLSAALASEAVSTVPSAIVIDTDRGPIVSGFVFIGNHDSDFEICLVTDTTKPNISLARGCLDTVPKAWPAGTPIWFTNLGERFVDEKVVRSVGETVNYKFLTRTSIGTLDEPSAFVFSQTVTARPHLPLRPANVKVNGHGFGDVAIGGSTDITLTWSTRNRTLEDGQALRWTDAPVAPEYRQGTVVTVADSTGTVVYQQYGLWTEDDLMMPASWFARYSDVYITVSSNKDDLASLQGHVIHVTGLPGDSSAALPPAPPALTDPPSPAAAPLLANWEIFGTSVSGTDGSEIPAIQLAGFPDVASVEDLVIRYRVSASVPWFVAPLIPLKNDFISTYITGVLAKTAYDVQIAYQLSYGADGTILSEWLDMGSVTTGAGVSSDSAALGARIAGEVLALLDGAVADGAALLVNLNQAIEDAEVSAETIIAQAMLQTQVHGYLEAMTYINDQPIGPIVQNTQVTTATLVETIAIMGTADLTGGVFALNITALSIDPITGEKLSDRFATLTANDNANAAATTTEQTARATADTAEATARLALAVTVGVNTAAIANNFSTLTTADTAEATARLALAAVVSTNSATMTTNATAAATANSATASELHTLGAWNGAHTAFNIVTANTTWDGVQTVASYLTGVTASFATTNAAVATEATTRATADTSEATLRTALASTVGTHTSSISFILSALGGNQATAVLAVDVNGHVTGFTINGSTAQFGIVASEFAIVDPGGGGIATSPFVYSAGIIYLNNTVYAQAIIANSITTDHLVNNSVTVPYNTSIGSFAPGTGSDQQIMAFTVVMVRPGYIKVAATISLGFSAIPTSWSCRLQINGGIYAIASGTVPGDSVALSGVCMGLAAGSYVVEIVVNNGSHITPGSCNLDGQGTYK